MKKAGVWCLLAVLALAVVVGTGSASNFRERIKKITGDLVGFEEPPSIVTGAEGEFRARVNKEETMITYELTYEGTEGTVQQAHIHVGQKGVNGGITVFLCTNLGNGPAGIQACPPAPATITGTIAAADVSPVIPATQAARNQGLDTGEFAELLRTIRAKSAYVNVHTTKWPSGEIRSQLRLHDGDHDHD